MRWMQVRRALDDARRWQLRPLSHVGKCRPYGKEVATRILEVPGLRRGYHNLSVNRNTIQ